jgi:hypothetical protein
MNKEEDRRRNAPKDPDCLLIEITTAMKMLPDAELLDLLSAVEVEAERRNLRGR